MSKPSITLTVHTYGPDFEVSLETLDVSGKPREFMRLGEACIVMDEEGLDYLQAEIVRHLIAKKLAKKEAA
jgi:hypothetical protein